MTRESKKNRRAEILTFEKIDLIKTGIRFTYTIDGQIYKFFNTVNAKEITLNEGQKYLIAANIGLSYLIDLSAICLPKTIVIKTIKLSSYALHFWKQVNEKMGMEIVFNEQLDRSYLNVQWIVQSDIAPSPIRTQKNSKTMLAMSGGKESLTALKVFEKVKDLALYYLYQPDKNWFYQKKVYEKLLPLFPSLKIRSDIIYVQKLKKKYGCKHYNVFVIGQLVFNALLYGDRYKYVIIGNEYSSNFGNGMYQGKMVNHQYDKALDFAKDINRYVKKLIHTNFIYFSPFFGLYEYKIAEKFFEDKKYFEVWTSCNQSGPKANFCCNCPKCAFIYILSLAFSTKKFLQHYFPKSPLENLELYKPLIDFQGVKPLDCVGEKIESWLALYHIYKQKKDTASPAMKHFVANILPKIEKKIDSMEKKIGKEYTGWRYIPTEYKKLVMKKLG